MEITSLKTPKRQETLGPTSPIQDWEVERATVMVELNESREKAERLEKQLEIDRQTYEKNTSSLLREVKLKESFMEKKLKDVEEQLMEQVLSLQDTLEKEKSARQEEIQKLKNQHEMAMEAEDKKYQRRLASFQERLTAKDKEYTDLIQRQTEERSDKENESLIESLKIELAKEKEKNEQPEIHLETEELESLCKELEEKLRQAELQINEYRDQQQQSIQNIEALKTDLAETQKQANMYKKRLDQTISGHDTHIRELTEKFMAEVQQAQMSNHAQLQNLQSEHTDILREIREQYETEKEVWQIQQTALLEELRRDLQFEKEEALRQVHQDYKERNQDLHASMSKDALEIQTHWEAKLKEAKVKNELKITRLQGEMEVVKDRLGKEIQRRKFNQTLLAETTEKNERLEQKLDKLQAAHDHVYKKYSKEHRQVTLMKGQYQHARRLAEDILASISPQLQIDTQTSLSDVLQIAVRHVSIMSIQRQVDSDRQDTWFDMESIPSYGY